MDFSRFFQRGRRDIIYPSETNHETSRDDKDMGIDKELLDILACPKCKGELELTEKEDGLICRSCRLLYEIRDDIPVMLIEEAKSLDEAD